jgi:Flp pilus assembly protein TadB
MLKIKRLAKKQYLLTLREHHGSPQILVGSVLHCFLVVCAVLCFCVLLVLVLCLVLALCLVLVMCLVLVLELTKHKNTTQHRQLKSSATRTLPKSGVTHGAREG